MSRKYNNPRKSIFDWFTLDITDLLRAVEQNDPAEVERALSARVNPNRRDGTSRLALAIAVNNNNAEIVEMLLKAKADPNMLDHSGQSPLFKAVFWNNLDTVSLLLNAGANPNFPNKGGGTPIDEAAQNNYTQILNLLQNKVNEKESQRIAKEKAKHQALRVKAERERQRKLKAIQREKAREESKKKSEASKELRKLEKLYHIKGSNYLKGLLRAINKKDSRATKLFLEKVKDINAYDEGFKTTPLMMAINQQNIKLANFIMEKGGNPLLIVPGTGYSAFTKAIALGNYELIKMITQKIDSAEIAAVLNDPKQVMSPQLLAYKDARILDLLLSAGGDAHFGGKDMPSPVVKAIEKASIAILPVLSRNKVDLNQMTQGRTPLGWAVYYQRIDWVNGLIEEGANVDNADEDGETVLFKAIKANLPEVVQLLLEAHADTTVRNKEGISALELARSLGDRDEIVQMLEE